MNEPLIMWEKWIDPFGKDVDQAKWTDYNNNIPNIYEDNLVEDENEYTDDESDTMPHTMPEDPIKVIASPLGLIPYNEYTASSKIFNFWLGHTNFNISNNIKKLIENTSGVEILDIFTRYRFRIAIGKCFNDADVMRQINSTIYNTYEKS